MICQHASDDCTDEVRENRGAVLCGYHVCVALGQRARARGRHGQHRKGMPLDEPMRPELVEALARSK